MLTPLHAFHLSLICRIYNAAQLLYTVNSSRRVSLAKLLQRVAVAGVVSVQSPIAALLDVGSKARIVWLSVVSAGEQRISSIPERNIGIEESALTELRLAISGGLSLVVVRLGVAGIGAGLWVE